MAGEEYFLAYGDKLPSNRFAVTPPERPELTPAKPRKAVNIPSGNPRIDESIWTELVNSNYYRDARAFSEAVHVVGAASVNETIN